MFGMVLYVPGIPHWLPQPQWMGHTLLALTICVVWFYFFLKFPLRYSFFFMVLFTGLDPMLWTVSFGWPSFFLHGGSLLELEAYYIIYPTSRYWLILSIEISFVALLTIKRWFKPNKWFYLFAYLFFFQSAVQLFAGVEASQVSYSTLDNILANIQHMDFLGAFVACTYWKCRVRTVSLNNSVTDSKVVSLDRQA